MNISRQAETFPRRTHPANHSVPFTENLLEKSPNTLSKQDEWNFQSDLRGNTISFVATGPNLSL